MNETSKDAKLQYHGRTVNGKVITISIELPMKIEEAWTSVQKSELFQYVTKGLITFIPIKGKFPEIWKEGMEVKTRMLFFGFIPFGGVHVLNFVKIDDEKHELITNEYDSAAKIWNHKISMEEVKNEGRILYEDKIEIYGGILTPIITWWAKLFYKYRQKKWLKLASKPMKNT